ncbi:hypothetical protein CKY10_22975 [Photorhabdus sp. HUG-39]|nr:hypothetical protein CKY10_22975 [Photorhabdus sp. HUG-39]
MQNNLVYQLDTIFSIQLFKPLPDFIHVVINDAFYKFFKPQYYDPLLPSSANHLQQNLVCECIHTFKSYM